MHPEYGTKYVCFKCGCKFYDLKKPESLCPKCGENQKNAPHEEINQANIRFGKIKVSSKSSSKVKKEQAATEKVTVEDDTEELLSLDEKFKKDVITTDESEEEEGV
jgi:uncharacterized protein (TIGR02300 family)